MRIGSKRRRKNIVIMIGEEYYLAFNRKIGDKTSQDITIALPIEITIDRNNHMAGSPIGIGDSLIEIEIEIEGILIQIERETKGIPIQIEIEISIEEVEGKEINLKIKMNMKVEEETIEIEMD